MSALAISLLPAAGAAAAPAYASAVAKATVAAKKSAARGLHFKTRSGTGIPSTSDLDGTDGANLLSTLVHGIGAKAPVFSNRVQSTADPGADWISDQLTTLRSQHQYSHYFAGPSIDPNDLWLDDDSARRVQRQVTRPLKNTAPIEPYFAAEKGTLEHVGVAKDGVYLSTVYDRTGVVNSAIHKYSPRRTTTGQPAMTPVFPAGSDPAVILENVSRAFATNFTILDTSRGVREIRDVVVGRTPQGSEIRVDRVRGIVAKHPMFDGDELQDFWPVYDASSSDPQLPENQRMNVSSWATGENTPHDTKKSLKTNDRLDAVVAFKHGAPSRRLGARSATPGDDAPAFELPESLDAVGPGYTGNNASELTQLIENKSAARPAKKAVPAGVERRAYLVDDSAANGVRVWDVYDLEPNGNEVFAGRSASLSLGRNAAFASANEAISNPSARSEILSPDGTRLELRWKFVDDAWIVGAVDLGTDLVRAVAVVDPARYAGQGAKWKPTL